MMIFINNSTFSSSLPLFIYAQENHKLFSSFLFSSSYFKIKKKNIYKKIYILEPNSPVGPTAASSLRPSAAHTPAWSAARARAERRTPPGPGWLGRVRPCGPAAGSDSLGWSSLRSLPTSRWAGCSRSPWRRLPPSRCGCCSAGTTGSGASTRLSSEVQHLEEKIMAFEWKCVAFTQWKMTATRISESRVKIVKLWDQDFVIMRYFLVILRSRSHNNEILFS